MVIMNPCQGLDTSSILVSIAKIIYVGVYTMQFIMATIFLSIIIGYAYYRFNEIEKQIKRFGNVRIYENGKRII